MQEDYRKLKGLEEFVIAQEIRRQANEAERIAKDEKRSEEYGSDSTYITIKDETGSPRKVGVDSSGCLTVDGAFDWENIPDVTPEHRGLMVSPDKIKLDDLPEDKITNEWIDKNLNWL